MGPHFTNSFALSTIGIRIPDLFVAVNYMLDQNRLRALTEEMRRELRAGVPFGKARNKVFQGLYGDERTDYISAVSSELSYRRHIGEARSRPEVPPPPKEARPTPDPQLGFGFGEGPRRRSPTRRHL